MFTIADMGSKRLEKVLVKDKTEDPKKLAEIIKSDIYILLQNYMELKNLDVNFDVDIEGYTLNIKAEAKRIKTFGILQNWLDKWALYVILKKIIDQLKVNKS